MRNLILSFFLAGMLSPVTAWSQPVYAPDLRCMPVLIEIPLPDGTHLSHGTGVYLTDSNKLFLVTAAHVIFDVTNKPGTLINSNATVSSCVRGNDLKARAVFTLHLKHLHNKGLLKRHPNRDIAVILIATLTPTTNYESWVPNLTEGVSTTNSQSPVPWIADKICKTFQQVTNGNEVYVLGYPVSLVIKPLYEDIDFTEPMLRRGVISQKNQKSGRLIVDSAVYPGNSGGPALIVEHPSFDETVFNLAGIVIKYVPVLTDIEPQIGVTNRAFANSGYGVVEPIDYALELMRQ